MKNKIAFLCLFIFLYSSNALFSQGEANIWCFGNNAGVDFNSGVPVAFTGSAIHDNEGCAGISTSAGALRFYTDGVTVWNRLHLPMPNGTGLYGHGSCTQSSMVVPKPGSTDIYYVFTQYQTGLSLGFEYSVVDMSLDGGLGDVTIKNVMLATPTSEKLTAIKNANNIDIWVIAHDYATDAFYTYAVTAAGLNVVPIISHAGTAGSIHYYGGGYLRASADGKKLAQGLLGTGLIDMLNFNATTGGITLDYTLTLPVSMSIGNYGIEFSPNRKLLYLTGEPSSIIVQLDLTLPTPAMIVASATTIASYSTTLTGALQIGPDGKIYFAKWSGSLGCINKPNVLGTGCSFVDGQVNLLGGICRFGLPNFIQTYFYIPPINYTNTCFADSTHFSLADNSPIDSVSWNFNDPVSGVNNTSTSLAPAHVFTSPGTYAVSVISQTGSIIDTSTINVSIIAGPAISLGADTILCNGATMLLNAAASGAPATYLWQDGSTGSSITASAPGIYYVNASNGCGTATDTIRVIPPPVITVSSPVICATQIAVLTASGADTFSWPVGVTSASSDTAFASPLSTTSYTVTGTTQGCASTGVATVTVNPLPDADFNIFPAGIIKPGTTVTFAGPSTGATVFSWGFGDLQSADDTSALMAPLHAYSAPGEYCISLVTTGSLGCTNTTRQCITVENTLVAPNVFTPNGDGKNDEFVIENLAPGSALKIYNRWGAIIYEASPYANNWAAENVSDGVYYYIVSDPVRKKEYSGFVQVIAP